MIGCGETLRGRKCDVTDSNGITYKNVEYRRGGDGWDRFVSDDGKIYQFSGDYTVIER
jgi:hypothetical protein